MIPQQEAKNFDPYEKGPTAYELAVREYKSLIGRFPSTLTSDRRAQFEYDLRQLLSCGLYRDETGKEEVQVTEVCLMSVHDRPIDACVVFENRKGRLPSGRLPVLFFIETFHFLRADVAS